MSAEPELVLVVDDEPLVCTMLGDAIRMFGYNVTAASGGPEALRLVSAVAPALALLDLRMPGMPGMEVLKRLRAGYPRLPVVIVSGEPDDEVKRQALEAGAFDYVAKPFSIAHLKIVVKAAILSAGRNRD